MGSKEWQEGEPETDSSSTPTVIELPSLKDEVPFIDYSQDACEVLGPVQAVHGHPIKVLGAINDVQSATMLYRYFEADLLKTGRDVITELHSLQLLPFYTSGMFLFFFSIDVSLVSYALSFHLAYRPATSRDPQTLLSWEEVS